MRRYFSDQVIFDFGFLSRHAAHVDFHTLANCVQLLLISKVQFVRIVLYPFKETLVRQTYQIFHIQFIGRIHFRRHVGHAILNGYVQIR